MRTLFALRRPLLHLQYHWWETRLTVKLVQSSLTISSILSVQLQLLKAVMFCLKLLLFKQHDHQSSVLKYHKQHDNSSNPENLLKGKEAMMDGHGLPCLAEGSGLLAFLVRLIQTGLCPGWVLDGRKVICGTWGQAHRRVDTWIRRPSRGQGQRLRSHGWGCVGAVCEGQWWRIGLSRAGQLTYHI